MGMDSLKWRLFDNLSPKMVIKFLKEQMQHNGGVLDVTREARALAQYAFNFSLDDTYSSPFSIRAKQQKRWYSGGKSDDITVVVARVHSQ
jgi:protein phosphatase PTC7